MRGYTIGKRMGLRPSIEIRHPPSSARWPASSSTRAPRCANARLRSRARPTTRTTTRARESHTQATRGVKRRRLTPAPQGRRHKHRGRPDRAGNGETANVPLTIVRAHTRRRAGHTAGRRARHRGDRQQRRSVVERQRRDSREAAPPRIWGCSDSATAQTVDTEARGHAERSPSRSGPRRVFQVGFQHVGAAEPHERIPAGWSRRDAASRRPSAAGLLPSASLRHGSRGLASGQPAPAIAAAHAAVARADQPLRVIVAGGVAIALRERSETSRGHCRRSARKSGWAGERTKMTRDRYWYRSVPRVCRGAR